MIEPYWEQVSIYDGPKVFLRQFEQLPEPAGHLLAVWWCNSEVCNGGFDQFFFNSTGVLAPEAATGFRAIGLTECAELVEAAMGKFGESYPRDRTARQTALETLQRPAQTGELPGAFDELDKRYYAAKERSKFEQTLDDYAQRAVP